jgi:hypothetical protein
VGTETHHTRKEARMSEEDNFEWRYRLTTTGDHWDGFLRGTAFDQRATIHYWADRCHYSLWGPGPAFAQESMFFETLEDAMAVAEDYLEEVLADEALEDSR